MWVNMKTAFLVAALFTVSQCVKTERDAAVAAQAIVFPGCPCDYDLLWPASCRCSNDQGTKKSPVCPTNYWFYEPECECICHRYAECPTNHKWSTTECGCLCDPDVICPVHYKWDVSKCQCVCKRLCPKGKVLDESSCTCICPNSCEACEFQNPSNCECEGFTELLAVMSKTDPSVQKTDPKETVRKYYEYQRPKSS